MLYLSSMTETKKKPTSTRSRAKSSARKKSRLLSTDRLLNFTYICVGLAIVLVATQFSLYGLRYRNLFDTTSYQSVTLTSGQTFFGKLAPYSPKTYVLNDVYYLQASQQTSLTTEEGEGASTNLNDNVQLFRLTDDLHQPQNQLVLNRDQVLYWQNLQTDSPIVDTIQSQ